MPSLVRFLLIIGLLAVAIYGGMFALATLVKVTPREMEQIIPPSKLNK